MRRRNTLAGQRGSVGSVIVTMLVLIVVFGLAVVETGSIVFTKLSLENTASDVASDAVLTLNSSHNSQQACIAAQQSLETHDKKARLVVCSADPQDGEVKVTLRKVASTIVVSHVSFLRKLGVVKASADLGGPENS